MLGMFTPLGYVIIPKIQDPEYQDLPEDQWSEYRKHNKELGRADFDSIIEETYEQKKDQWLEKEQKGEQGEIAKERYKLGAWLGQQKTFTDAKSKSRQRIIAGNLFPQMTSAELDEIVEIARMGLDYKEIEKMAKQKEKVDK